MYIICYVSPCEDQTRHKNVRGIELQQLGSGRKKRKSCALSSFFDAVRVHEMWCKNADLTVLSVARTGSHWHWAIQTEYFRVI